MFQRLRRLAKGAVTRVPDFALGLDIGGTKSAAVLSTKYGEVIDRIESPTETAHAPSAVIDRLCRGAEELLIRNAVSKDRVLGVGVAAGGPMDAEAGIVCSPPNLPGWDNVPVVKMVSERLGLLTAMENDADAAALAEYRFGAGERRYDVVSFTWGTGVGAGIVIGGRLHRGVNGAAGEIGHITYIKDGVRCACGKLGCIEAYASGSSIERAARARISLGEQTMLSKMASADAKSVCEAARKGDKAALDILRCAAEAMGRAVAIAAHTLNPDVITLGTLAVAASDLMMPVVMDVVEKEVWSRIREGLRVMPSPLGSHVQDLAAVSVILEYIGR